MKNIFTALFFFISISLFSQQTEKRLALVIGNANYDKGELKNPVNDARLIASTLDSLDFDVILKENLPTRREMLIAIDEFGEKRDQYDVAFVYYAGHGIQIDNQNFLLPTKEVFEKENDVLDYSVSVQKIMRYLESKSDEVNILILDACRDNPFELNWKSTRSLKGGGLARLPAPTGSLIAFSTDSGQTAPDGKGENSIYSIVLSNELKISNISIEQVFKNVRTRVLELTNELQRPVEESKLTGGDFYMVPLNIVEIINKAIKLASTKDYYNALELITGLINNKNYKKSYAYRLRSAIYSNLNKYEKALDDINKYIELNEKNDNSYSMDGQVVTKKMLINYGYLDKGNIDFKFKFYENALESYSNVIEDNDDKFQKSNAMFLRGYTFQNFAETFIDTPQYFRAKEYLELAIKDYEMLIKNETKYAAVYNNLANAYSRLKKYGLALQTIEKALEIEPNNASYLVNKANKLVSLNENGKALELYNQIIDMYPSDPTSYYNRAKFYAGIDEHNKALIDYGKAEGITKNLSLLKEIHFHRAKSYHANEDYFNVILDLNKVIDMDPNDFYAYKNRALAYLEMEKYNNAIDDFEKTLQIAPDYQSLFSILAMTYKDIKNYEKAKLNFEKAISVDPKSFDNYLFLSLLYEETGEINKAVEILNVYNTNNYGSSDGYIKLGKLYASQQDFENADRSYKSALELDPNNIEATIQLGYMLFSQFKFDEALPYFERGNEIEPNNIEANFYLAMTYMAQGKENELGEIMNKISQDEELPEMMLMYAYLNLSHAQEDNDQKNYKKSLQILKQYDKKYGFSSISSLLQFAANMAIKEFDEALLNISQAISNFGKDSYSDDALKAVNMLKLYGKSYSSLSTIDLFLHRSWLYLLRSNGNGCKDLKFAIELIESTNNDTKIKYFYYGENRDYQNLVEIAKNCK